VHLAGENFADAAGVDLQHVPYKGEALGYNDLIAGQVQMMVGNFAAASALVGPTGCARWPSPARRMPQMPEVPTRTKRPAQLREHRLVRPAGAGRHPGRRDPEGAARRGAGDGRDRDQGAPVRAGHVAGGQQHGRLHAQIDQELVRWAKVVAARKLQAN
jgi:hypothetical protein